MSELTQQKEKVTTNMNKNIIPRGFQTRGFEIRQKFLSVRQSKPESLELLLCILNYMTIFSTCAIKTDWEWLRSGYEGNKELCDSLSEL